MEAKMVNRTRQRTTRKVDEYHADFSYMTPQEIINSMYDVIKSYPECIFFYNRDGDTYDIGYEDDETDEEMKNRIYWEEFHEEQLVKRDRKEYDRLKKIFEAEDAKST
jgi:hypothetical protein